MDAIETGLSPRVRGNHRTHAKTVLFSGSIPACAGEPVISAANADGDRVYPRVCGGTRWCSNTDGLHAGLSPRVRGNPGYPAGAMLKKTTKTFVLLATLGK